MIQLDVKLDGLDDSVLDDSGVDDSVLDDSGLDDSGVDDSGVDDSVLDDIGLDDSVLDDSGLDDSVLDQNLIYASLNVVQPLFITEEAEHVSLGLSSKLLSASLCCSGMCGIKALDAPQSHRT